MFKIVLKNYKLLLRIKKFSLITSKLFTFDIRELNEVKNAIYFDQMMSFFKNSNNTFKQTNTGRFLDLDKISVNYVNNNDIVHDVAVSSGVTSLELYNNLKKNKLNFNMCISDKYSKVNVCGDSITKVYDSEGKLLFGYFFNIYCCQFGQCNKIFIISSILFEFLKLFKPSKCQELMLFNPHVIESITNNEIKNIEYDIFENTHVNEFNFVRCMNIFNRAYFSDEKIREGLQNVKNSIKENGYLLIGRTLEDGTEKNIATIFQKKGDDLLLVQKINGGTDIYDLI